MKMQRSMISVLLLMGLMSAAVYARSLTVSMGDDLSESEPFLNFIKAIDPQGMLAIGTNNSILFPCLNKVRDVKCSQGAVVEIRLENLNLAGKLDVDSICKLPNLRVLSLAKNNIQGNIPDSILQCTRLTHLNFSSNNLSGKVPLVLSKLKHLRSLDLSNNHFTTITPRFNKEFKYRYSLKSLVTQQDTISVGEEADNSTNLSPISLSSESSTSDKGEAHWLYHGGIRWLVLILGIVLFLMFSFFVGKRVAKLASKKQIQKPHQKSPVIALPAVPIEKEKQDKSRPELVFFIEENEPFKLEDLLEATADLRSHNICSSLFKIMLKNKDYAVKTLRKTKISFGEFCKTMRLIGDLRHPNVLPLVGYYSANEEKLLIYKYQRNGSLQDLLDNSIEGKQTFPWRLRLSIARGIAKGLDFIYQRSNAEDSIPHGNLKPSNVLLNENNEPQISEYGITKVLDPKRAWLLSSKGYIAPEKKLSEKADVFSFGVIMLELLTGKSVAKSGINLPKWVRAKVREEWTCEVFDEEVAQNAEKWAFSLLIIAMECASHYPEGRPTMAKALERIEEVVKAVEDYEKHASPLSSDFDTPGSHQ